MAIQQSPELPFAEELARVLATVGAARLEYITAEMQPFSNQQRPDVVFIPKSGGYAGQIIFIEIKLSIDPLQGGHQLLVEHRNFAAQALESSIGKYAYVTNAIVPEFSKKFLMHRSIYVIDGASAPGEVANSLIALAAIPK